MAPALPSSHLRQSVHVLIRHKSFVLGHPHGPLPHHLSYVPYKPPASLRSRLLAVVICLNEKCPPQSGASEHSVPSWWHCLGRFIWGSLSGGSLPWLGVGFESLKLSLLPFLLDGCYLDVVGMCSRPPAPTTVVLAAMPPSQSRLFSLRNHKYKETLLL